MTGNKDTNGTSTGLDGVGRSLVSAVKKETGSAGLLTEVYRDTFAPAQRLWGEERRRKAAEKIVSRREAEREANLRQHLSQSQCDKETIDVGTAETDELVFKWLDAAQDINPKDQELSAVWQGLLMEIRAGNSKRNMLMKTISALEADEASVILNYSESESKSISSPRSILIKKDSADFITAKKLELKGLLNRKPFLQTRIGMVASFLLAMLILLYASLFMFDGILLPTIFENQADTSAGRAQLRNLIVLSFIGLSSFTMHPIYSSVRRVAEYETTWLFIEIKALGLTQLKKNSGAPT
ncbi:MAG: hypothetical protein A3E78_01670 [Alphaproteobacteria bacterium RIFCSPHIGHO2_12_FULL_63_12]|nr:MAG: hypothetical protein A3E78_01670 [Alphaproteobacteria bacterium RIFCSPHIGHO2_12_FULL_63_12]